MVTVERWGIFESRFTARFDGNAFTGAIFGAVFIKGHRPVNVDGFYDGEDTWVVRFMPDSEGVWTYRTFSSIASLDGIEGTFECTAPSKGNHGPVRVADIFHFAYADGTRHVSIGTTCYAWVHQGDALAEQTLASLAAAPFNKLRMMLFPKNYKYCDSEPQYHAFDDGPPNKRAHAGVSMFSSFAISITG